MCLFFAVLLPNKSAPVPLSTLMFYHFRRSQ